MRSPRKKARKNTAITNSKLPRRSDGGAGKITGEPALPTTTELNKCVNMYKEAEQRFEVFRSGVVRFFETRKELTGDPPVVHSTKSRLKNPDHLLGKLLRKNKDAPKKPINESNFFKRMTDLAGVRVFHLYQAQFQPIHEAIMAQVGAGDWVLNETPKAYTWDPDAQEYFRSFELKTEMKPSHYTSVHYCVRPKKGHQVCCEIQVRTLLEETWGEIDHLVNYPAPTKSEACKEQLRVLAKVIGAGTRLADSIIRSSDAPKTT